VAESLKLFFDKHIVRDIAAMVLQVHPGFAATRFEKLATSGLQDLELLPRARHIAAALESTLPANREAALEIITQSLPPVIPVEENHDFSSFIYLPYTIFIYDHGPAHYNVGIRACYEITQRFTAEYCIRPFLLADTERTLGILNEWTTDASHHVRRLVSEGTRPRLPWAPRLPIFQRNPAPVLALLELLRDDPSRYVRRSVANNLNDIGKDNPDALVATAHAWLEGASAERERLVRHALRSLIKQGHTKTLALLGYETVAEVQIENALVEPRNAHIGDTVCIEFTVHNPSGTTQSALLDLIVHFVIANGSASPKVFKLTELHLLRGESRLVRKNISVKQHTTRTHYPGTHRIDVQINGSARYLGEFHLSEGVGTV
jgi:3-methyladenine DNA glycosylase AlkC